MAFSFSPFSILSLADEQNDSISNVTEIKRFYEFVFSQVVTKINLDSEIKILLIIFAAENRIK